MKQIYHAVPCEDGGWKILVQIIPQTEQGKEEFSGSHSPPVIPPGSVTESMKAQPGAPQSET